MLQAGHTVQLGKETAPQHVVTRLHAVDGEHRALRICICERPDRVSDAISTRRCGEGKLKRRAKCCHSLPKLTGQHLRNQPAERRARRDPTRTGDALASGWWPTPQLELCHAVKRIEASSSQFIKTFLLVHQKFSRN